MKTMLTTTGAVVLGGLLGAGTAMLLAPKSGRETRKLISDFAVNTTGKVRGSIKSGRRKILVAGIKALL